MDHLEPKKWRILWIQIKNFFKILHNEKDQ